jgi:hypothetical protein
MLLFLFLLLRRLLLCLLSPPLATLSHWPVHVTELTGGISTSSSLFASSSLSSWSVILGGGSSSRCGAISGLAGSGTANGLTAASSTGTTFSTDAEIWSMFFLWMRSSREGRDVRRGRRPSMKWCRRGQAVQFISTRANANDVGQSSNPTPSTCHHQQPNSRAASLHHMLSRFVNQNYLTDHCIFIVCFTMPLDAMSSQSDHPTSSHRALNKTIFILKRHPLRYLQVLTQNDPSLCLFMLLSLTSHAERSTDTSRTTYRILLTNCSSVRRIGKTIHIFK